MTGTGCIGFARRDALLPGLLALLLAPGASVAAEDCEQPAARVVAADGDARVAVSDGASTILTEGMVICPGDVLTVGSARVSLRLPNETVLRLRPRSRVAFEALPETRSWLEVLRGAVHFMSRTPQRGEIHTPFVNAAIDGTEFLVSVDGNEARVSVFEGTVGLSNDAGRLRLAAGETGGARRGAAPSSAYPRVGLREAAAWALYYPPIVAPPEAAPGEAVAAYRRGDLSAALSALREVPATERDVDHSAFMASILLRQGRVDEAQSTLERVLGTESDDADALALAALVDLVRGDEQAAEARLRGLAADRVSVMLARSYLAQARFDLAGADAAVARAAALAPDEPMILARRAELALALGRNSEIRPLSRRLAGLDAATARARTALGFLQLADGRTDQARDTFAAAMDGDPTDPLAALGAGLVEIRAGELERGREALEEAVLLDPGGSVVRSYLGKSYYEERRNDEAAIQYRLAKRLDPDDPTPWFYDAIREQADNRPLTAVTRFEEARQRNDNRAVIRSRLLLDRDAAARDASLARTYRLLGFTERARQLGADAVAEAPAEHSGHRLLAELYADEARFERLRAAERLQAQLLQPPGARPLPLGLDEPELLAVPDAGPSDLGLDEYNALFLEEGVFGALGGLVGTQDTDAQSVTVGGFDGRTTASFSGYRYRSDGFRDNADASYDLASGLLRHQLTPALSLELELRHRRDETGDLAQRFYQADFSENLAETFDRDSVRGGLAYAPAPGHTLLVDLRADRVKETETDFQPARPPGEEDIGRASIDVDARGDIRNRKGELRYDLVSGDSTLQLGGSHAEHDSDGLIRIVFDDIPIETVPGGPVIVVGPQEEVDDISETTRTTTAYAYHHWRPGNGDLRFTFGAEFVDFNDESFDRSRVNPKAGVRWRGERAALGLAAFRTLASRQGEDAGLQPTHIAGSPQVHDDFAGTEGDVYALNGEIRVGAGGVIGLAYMRRELDQPVQATEVRRRDIREDAFQVYWSQPLPGQCGIRVGYRHRDLERSDLVSPTPLEVSTHSVPLRAGCALGRDWFVSAGVEGVRQSVELNPRTANLDRDLSPQSSFAVVDAAVSFRLPDRLGTLTLSGRNLLDREFKYYDQSFTSVSKRPARYLPERTVFATLNLNF